VNLSHRDPGIEDKTREVYIIDHPKRYDLDIKYHLFTDCAGIRKQSNKNIPGWNLKPLPLWEAEASKFPCCYWCSWRHQNGQRVRIITPRETVVYAFLDRWDELTRDYAILAVGNLDGAVEAVRKEFPR
jgi:hypothetical protein